MTKERNRELSDFQTPPRTVYISCLALVVGALCALIAVLLMRMIGFFTNLAFYHRLSLAFIPDYPNHLGWLLPLVPMTGGLVIGLMARFGSEKIRGHGIPEALEAILIGKSIVSPRVAVLKPISAAISIGTGGPFGAEGPIIMTGGSVASLFAQMLHLTAAERKILLVAGAAGGMSATFAAPLASVLFAVELLIFEMRPRSLVPIALASGVADMIRSLLIGAGPMFPSSAAPVLNARGLLVALAFGVAGGALAWLLTRAIYGVEDLFHKLPIHWMWWPVIGGFIVGLGGLVVPQALGVGYDSIASLVQGHMVLSLALGLLLVKSLIWVGALSSGTSGGILAPLLIIGGTLGDAVAQVFHFSGHGSWAMLGMAAAFAGVTRSPLTTVVFVLELTHDVGMILPLLLASAAATVFSALFLPRSILTEKIARRGLHVARDYSVDPLEQRLLREVMTGCMVTMGETLAVREALDRLLGDPGTYSYTQYPVVSVEGRVVGLVSLKRLLPWFGREDAGGITVGDICLRDIRFVADTRTARHAIEQMADRKLGMLIVTGENGQPAGLVTRSDVMKARRKQMEEESLRTRHLLLRMPRALRWRRALSSEAAAGAADVRDT